MKALLSPSRCLWLISSFLLILDVSLNAQQILVISDRGEPLIGVEIFSSELDFSTVTDEAGQATIDDWDRQGVLTFRSLGFITQNLSFVQLQGIDLTIVLKNDSQQMEDILIIGRSRRNSRDVPQQITTITSTKIQSTQPQTAADALDQHGNIYVQKSQMGGGSPIIRGFEANRVLLVVDGIRMNNAIYRSGHLQNTITIDPAILERTDIIFGPNSLLYGSDALGGVVHFQSKKPSFLPRKR